MGGARYCGFRDGAELNRTRRSGKFLVSMGLYKDIPAVQRAWRAYVAVEPGIFEAMGFAPLVAAPFEPHVVIVTANGLQAMELLHANAYEAGARGIGGDAGPICSSLAAVPFLTGKVAYSFADVGSRDRMGLEPEEVLLGIPGSELLRIARSLEEMVAKNAFRER